MATDMTSQVPSKHSPTIELQGDIQFAHTIKYPSLYSSIVLQALQQQKSLLSLLNWMLIKLQKTIKNLFSFKKLAENSLYLGHAHEQFSSDIYLKLPKSSVEL